MSSHGKIRIEKDLESMNELSWKTDRDTGAASARQGREGGAALFASSPSSPLEVDFLCIRVPRKQGKGAEWVHWMFWLMWVPTFKCQSLLPHLMYKEHSWLYVTASQPGQWRPPSLVSRTHSYSNAALLWGPNIRSSPADVSFLWFFTLLGPH